MRAIICVTGNTDVADDPLLAGNYVVERILRPSAPHQAVGSRVDEVEDDGARLVLLGVCRVWAADAGLGPRFDGVHTQAADSRGVVLNSQVRLRASLRAAQGAIVQLALNLASEVILENCVVVQTRIAGGQPIGRSPVPRAIGRNVHGTRRIGANADRRAAAQHGRREKVDTGLRPPKSRVQNA
jgi:hypothetical protein